MSVKKVLAGLVAVIAVITMSGCSSDRGVTAVEVGDWKLSQVALDQEVNDLLDVLVPINEGYRSMDATRFVLETEIVGRIITEVLEQMDVSVTEEMIQQFMLNYYGANSVMHVLRADPRIKGLIDGMITWNVVTIMRDEGMIDNAVLANQLSKVSKTVKVNPRYGDWDVVNLTVASRAYAQVQQGSLAEPTAFTIPQ